MARRKDENILSILSMLPWWVSLATAAIVYIGLKFILPNINFGNPYLQPMALAISNVAGYLSCIFLIGVPLSLINRAHRRKLLDNQTSIQSIRDMSWQDFELLVGEVFRRKGYSVTENGGGGADGGIDLILTKPGRKVVVQCKRWKTATIGVTYVRELYGIMNAQRATACIFVSSGDYTKEAMLFSEGKPIDLIDGMELYKLIKEVQKDQPQPKYTEAPNCPKCGSKMIQREAKQGANAGNKFWGCPRYPSCRGTL